MFKIFLVAIILRLPYVISHGVMTKPISMSAKLSFGNDPTGVPDYDSHSLFCGGIQNTYVDYRNDPNQFPKCGVCGDSINGPKDHEPNGRFYDDRIVETYRKGQVIDVNIKITASHLGNMYFQVKSLDKLPWDDSSFIMLYQPNSQQNMTVTSYNSKKYTALYVLPNNITCNKCIIRWNWLAANNPPSGGQPNEFYRNCAFVKITGDNTPTPASTSPTTTTTQTSAMMPCMTPAPLTIPVMANKLICKKRQ